jgi:hypothetical protein
MVFLLSFLTISNSVLFAGQACIEKKIPCPNQDDDDCSKRPMNPEEEKSSSRSISNSLNEEYLHEHDLFMHLYISEPLPAHYYVHPHGFGDDHSSLDCPPPDQV